VQSSGLYRNVTTPDRYFIETPTYG
jgi:hypothetical protein